MFTKHRSKAQRANNTIETRITANVSSDSRESLKFEIIKLFLIHKRKPVIP